MFVAAADDLEQVRGGFSGHRQIAELVDQQDLWSVPEAHRGRPAAFDRGPGGAGDEVGGGGVVDAVAGLDGFVAEDRGEHRLAGAGWADEERVGFLVDEAQGREVLDESAVQRGLGVEVELLECAPGWELGEAQAALEAALLDGVDLGGDQVVQEPGVAGLVAFGGFQRGREAFGDGGQAQVREVAAQLLVERVAGHRWPAAVANWA